MRQAKIQWGGQPPRSNTARAAAVSETWAPPAALYTGMGGLGLAAVAMLIAAGLARQPDIGAVSTPPVPAAENLPAPAERPDAPVALAAATGTDGGVAPDATPSGEPASAETLAAPVASRFGDAAGAPRTAPPSIAAADAGAPDPGLAAFAGGEAPTRAALASEERAEPVEVAATEAEVLAIEERLAAQGDPNFVLPPEPGADPTALTTGLAAAPPAAQAGLPPAWVREHVNLRAGPDNDAPILAIIPGNAVLAAEEGCEHWCEAVYEGQSGFVYSSFIRRDAP